MWVLLHCAGALLPQEIGMHIEHVAVQVLGAQTLSGALNPASSLARKDLEWVPELRQLTQIGGDYWPEGYGSVYTEAIPGSRRGGHGPNSGV